MFKSESYILATFNYKWNNTQLVYNLNMKF